MRPTVGLATGFHVSTGKYDHRFRGAGDASRLRTLSPLVTRGCGVVDAVDLMQRGADYIDGRLRY
jgi:hypothetical protein